jgi:uncharacterized protein YraI
MRSRSVFLGIGFGLLLMLLLAAPSAAQGPSVSFGPYGDLDWDFNQEDSIHVFSVCTDGIHWVHEYEGQLEYEDGEYQESFAEYEADRVPRLVSVYVHLGPVDEEGNHGPTIAHFKVALPRQETPMGYERYDEAGNRTVYKKFFYGEFRKFWPELLAPGTLLAIDGGSWYEEDEPYTVEDCYLDPKNNPNREPEAPAKDTAAAPVAAPAAPAADEFATTRITAATLNARGGPGLDFPIVDKLARGDVFDVVGRNAAGSWIRLILPDAADGYGWINTKYGVLSVPANEIPVDESTSETSEPAVSKPAALPAAAGKTSLVTDFEKFGQWRRGDEEWGTFVQDQEIVHGGNNSGRIDYDFPAGVANNYVVFLRTIPLTGEPAALELWVDGDGSQHFLNAWVEDAQKQRWQFTFGRVNHTGWQKMTAPFDLAAGWPNQAVGSAATAAPVYPLSLYALVLDAYTDGQPFAGSIYVDDLKSVE